MAKRKVASKSTKKATKTKKGVSNGLYATEHDFIIIIGGGLVVLMLATFLFFLQ